MKQYGIAIALSAIAAAAVAAIALPKLDGIRFARSDAPHSAAFASSAVTRNGSALPASGKAAQTAAAGKGVYLIVFKEAPLGGNRALPRRVDARGMSRLDVKSTPARNYVSYLRARQGQHVDKIELAISRPLPVRQRMQHALNAIVVVIDGAEAERIARLPEVLLVEANRDVPMDTDTGPALIGAVPVWTGSATGTPYQGEGVVVGIIDTGINFGSPSFAAQDPIDGYVHLNPVAGGAFLGTCAPGGDDAGRCNTKLIGGYDFVCGPPGLACGQPNIREEPGFGDSNGHGSHTASTAAGNRRDATYKGNVRRISGVAPRANVVAFDVCYTNTQTGGGLCPSLSSAAAVDQAVADGIVDVLNFSIGGGTSPWTDVVSIAFRNAVNAGIFVAASAGNSGPGANTLGHVEPWVSSTAAAQHGRGNFVYILTVTGPPPVPANLTSIPVNEGVGGVAHTSVIPGTTPLKISPNIDAANDGCTAGTPYPGGTFTGAIAVVRRGGCAFTEKVTNAAAAGALAVVIANNVAGVIIPSVPGATIRVFSVTQAEGNALRDFGQAQPTATAQIGYPALMTTNTPDVLAAFSSRGPAGTFNLLKPDVTAPGVLVLAAYAGTTITGFENLVEVISGTSMASPHQAGAAALVRQARPTWTVPEIKSAMAMTATPKVLLEDGVTPAGPFARGSGRIRVDHAVNAGLVLHETDANYIAANPITGGEPATLNQPSFAHNTCAPTCTFTRTFRNPTSVGHTWSVKLQGLPGTVSTSFFKIRANSSVVLTVTIDTSTLPPGWSFGTLVMHPSTLPLRGLQLPIAVKKP